MIDKRPEIVRQRTGWPWKFIEMSHTRDLGQDTQHKRRDQTRIQFWIHPTGLLFTLN